MASPRRASGPPTRSRRRPKPAKPPMLPAAKARGSRMRKIKGGGNPLKTASRVIGSIFPAGRGGAIGDALAGASKARPLIKRATGR
jgi:hypothetical protein